MATVVLESHTYRKLPIPIKAVKFSISKGEDYVEELASWCGGTLSRDFADVDDLTSPEKWAIQIPTEEGPMWSRPGDYIVQGPFGEFWSVKEHIFDSTYERIKEE